MEAQSEAVERLLAMNKKWDTVIVYPAFGNEVCISVINRLEFKVTTFRS